LVDYLDTHPEVIEHLIQVAIELAEARNPDFARLVVDRSSLFGMPVQGIIQ